MEDSQIIELFFVRAEGAVAELTQKYGRLCRSIAYNILSSRQDAEECENDTYLRVWDTVPPVRPESLRAYVSRIVRNLSLDRLRYRLRQKRGNSYDILLSELSECIPDERTDVEASADDTVIRSIEAYLRTLDESTRILFVRRYFHMESVESLAKRYGLKASSVSTRLLRTRARLRIWLEQEGVSI